LGIGLLLGAGIGCSKLLIACQVKALDCEQRFILRLLGDSLIELAW